jgi:hypothetical protein
LRKFNRVKSGGQFRSGGARGNRCACRSFSGARPRQCVAQQCSAAFALFGRWNANDGRYAAAINGEAKRDGVFRCISKPCSTARIV